MCRMSASLPSELLLLILEEVDLKTLGRCRLCCKTWLVMVDTSIKLWRSRLRKHFFLNPLQLPIRNLPLYSEVEGNAKKMKRLYRKLLKLDENVAKGVYRVKIIDCLEAVFDGKKCVNTNGWDSNYNYKGVYDMILDKNR